MNQRLQKGFRLGEFAVFPPSGTISGPGGTHHVPPAAMDVLLCLAEAPGEIVSRDFLLTRIWADAQSSDAALTRCVSELRHQLDDHRENPAYIQTLPTRGYRLIAAVAPIADGDDPTAEQRGDSQVQSALPLSQGFKGFIVELRRRRVFRVALVYLVSAWLIIQIVQAVFPPLHIPGWGQTLVVMLTVLGFPIALILAWAYQVTPDGPPADATSVNIVLDSRRRLDFIVIFALLAVVTYLLIELYSDAGVDRQPDIAQSPAAQTDEITRTDANDASIAVLPFVNLSDDEANEYFSEGLSEEILNLLTRIKELKVAARTSSFYFKGKDVDIPMVASHLGVKHVLEGSVRRQGNKIRVTAQLINADTNFHLWSETYDRELSDIFEIQDDVARRVVQALELVLSNESGDRLDRQSTPSIEAYEYYLQGRSYLRLRRDEATLASAVELFDRAISIDPDYAKAYAGLCDTYLALYEISRSTEYFANAELACHRGLTLDNAAGDVYVALGNLYRHSGQNEKAEMELMKAIALNPDDVDAYDGLAETYNQWNRLEEAEKNFQRAIDIQPRYWRGHLQMGTFLFESGRTTEAIDAFRRVTDLTPDNATGFLNLGSAYYHATKFENAAAAWQKSLELSPSRTVYSNIGSSYFFLGRFDEAVEMYRNATELAPDDYEAWGSLGDAYRFTEEQRGLAIPAYRKAIELAEKRLLVNPNDADTMAPLAQYYANVSEAERATELMAKAVQNAPQKWETYYFAAVANVSLGKTDAALAAIEQAVELGFPADLLAVDAGLLPLQGNERFDALSTKHEE